jgi:hypothetical protein
MTRATFVKDFEAFTIRNGKKPNAIMCDKTDKEYPELIKFCELSGIDVYECFTIPFLGPKFILI